jgi:hypothetical protein
MLILNSDHVKSVLTMKGCMEALEDAYRDNALGRTVNHRRTHLHMATSQPDRVYRFKTMPGGIEKLGLLAIRLNSDMMTWPVIDGTRRQIKVAAAPGNRFVGQILIYNIEACCRAHRAVLAIDCTTAQGLDRLRLGRYAE